MSNTSTSSRSVSSTSTWMNTRIISATPMDLETETSRGISFKKFFMLAFCLKKDTFIQLYTQASKWTAEPEFVEKLKECELRAKELSEFATESVEELGNIALAKALDDHSVAADRRVRLIHTAALRVDGRRSPDIAIVPASVGNRDLVRGDRFDWRRALGTIQVWFPLEPRPTKRKRAIVEDLVVAPPSKRSKSPTSGDVATSPQTIVSKATCNRDDTIPQKNHHAKETDEPSLSDTSTDVGSSRSNASNSSSHSTLYRESAEGELVTGFSYTFSAEGDRSFAVGACIYGTHMKLMYCSHSGIVESDEIDFVLKPQLFVMFLLMFATSSLSDLGFNAKTGFRNPFNIDDAETRHINVTLETFASDNNQAGQPDLKQAVTGQKIVSQSGIVGRVTTVYRLEGLDYPLGLVLKYSWQPTTRRREDEIIRVAREADPIHTPELFGTAVVETDPQFELLRNMCRRKSRNYEARELRVMVLREYHPLSELGFADEFWDAYVQLLGCAHDLYKKKRILHHDISMKNLAFYRDESRKPVAVLIDFDLAMTPPFKQVSRECERFGTAPFLAREYLIDANCNYDFHHDLESFFYCAVWHGLGYEVNDSESYPFDEDAHLDVLNDWRTGPYIRRGTMKYAFMASHFGSKALSKIPYEDYARRCKLLWQKFKRTSMALADETGEDCEELVLAPSWPDRKRETKVTYPMLVQALGVDALSLDACKDECCWQFKRKRQRAQTGLQ